MDAAVTRDRCRDLDRARALPAEVVEDLAATGIFRLLASREVGGDERLRSSCCVPSRRRRTSTDRSAGAR